MAGLLDDFKMPGMDTPQGQGLLAAAFSLMNAKGPSLGNAIGQAGGQYMGTYNQSRDADAQRKYRDMQQQQMQMQMEAAKRKQDQDARISAGMGQFFKPGQAALAPLMGDASTGILPSAGREAVAPSFDSQGASSFLARNGDWERAMNLLPKQEEAYTLGEGQQRFRGGQVVASGPEKKEKLDPNKPFMIVDGKIVPNEAFQAFELLSKKAGATNVTTNMPTQESEQSKAYGKNLGEQRAEITKAGFNAPATIAALDRMDALLKDVDGGKYSPVGVEVASAARSFGINIDPKLGNKEAAQALAIELALKQKPAGSGAMSDPEFDNYLSSVPGLSKTPEGRANISATMRAKAKRDAVVSKMARAYASKRNGVIDDGFFDEVANYQAANPIVSGAANSNTQSLLNKYPPRSK